MWEWSIDADQAFAITARDKTYHVLLNDAAIGIRLFDATFNTVWHLYYALLFHDSNVQYDIVRTKTREEARLVVIKNSNKIIHKDEDVLYSIMVQCVRYKLKQHPIIFKILKQLENETIVVLTPDDRMWGAVYNSSIHRYYGNNLLGYILKLVLKNPEPFSFDDLRLFGNRLR